MDNITIEMFVNSILVITFISIITTILISVTKTNNEHKK